MHSTPSTIQALSRRIVIPVGFVVTIGLSGCSSDAPNTAADSSAGAAEADTAALAEDCADPAAVTKKITDTLTIGYSLPMSGPVAGPVEAVAAGYKARIAAENAKGGIDGVKINVVYKDDAYSPDKAKANGTEFLQNTKADALSTFGSGPLGAMADDQNAACVPMLYASASAPEFAVAEDYPWTTQYLPPATAEATALVKLVKQKFPDGVKLGIAENQNASGKANSAAFQEEAKKAGLTIDLVTPDTDPNAAATALKAADVKAVFHAGIIGSCASLNTAMARIGFKPDFEVTSSTCIDVKEFVSAGQAADGVFVAGYLQDPSDPTASESSELKGYLSDVKDVPGAEKEVPPASGWLIADLTVNTLKQAAASPQGLTRLSIIEAARDQDYDSPMLRDGITWLGTSDYLGVSAFQPIRFDAAAKRFVADGDVVSTQG